MGKSVPIWDKKFADSWANLVILRKLRFVSIGSRNSGHLPATLTARINDTKSMIRVLLQFRRIVRFLLVRLRRMGYDRVIIIRSEV